jgi:hypothetical protein
MSWAQLQMVSDGDIGAIEPQATEAGKPWGKAEWPTQRAEAKNDLAIWLERDHPDVPGVTDRVRDRYAPEIVLGYTGSAYTDLTSTASDDAAEDVALATILATFSTDRLYVGAPFAFSGLHISLLDSVSAATATLTVKYWGDAQWTDIHASDGTSPGAVTLAQSGRVTWAQPKDWERRDLNSQGQEWYWVELSVSAAPTAGTAATQILCLQPPKALNRCAVWLSLYHICNGIAMQAPEPERWIEKADKYLDMARTLYRETRVPLDLNLSGAISPDEAQTEARGPVRFTRG